MINRVKHMDTLCDLHKETMSSTPEFAKHQGTQPA